MKNKVQQGEELSRFNSRFLKILYLEARAGLDSAVKQLKDTILSLFSLSQFSVGSVRINNCEVYQFEIHFISSSTKAVMLLFHLSQFSVDSIQF